MKRMGVGVVALCLLAGCAGIRVTPMAQMQGTEFTVGGAVVSQGPPERTCAHVNVGVDPGCVTDVAAGILNTSLKAVGSAADKAADAVNGR